MTTSSKAKRRIIDLDREQALSLNEAREFLPGFPSFPTVYRYVTRGVNGIKLDVVRIGRRRFTSRSAIQRFVDDLTAKTDR